MPQIVSVGRLGNAAFVKSSEFKYATFPMSPGLLNPSNNFTISVIMYPWRTNSSATDMTDVIQILSRSINNSVGGVAVQYTLQAVYIVFSYANGIQARGAYQAFPNTYNSYYKKLVFVDFVKIKSGFAGTDTVDPSQWRFYFNGLPMTGSKGYYSNLAITYATDTSNSAPAYIVRSATDQLNGNDSYFAGYKVYNRALPDAEIYAKYIREGRLSLSGCVFDGNFDAKKGKVIQDRSGSGNHGALVGYSDAETANAGQLQSGNTAWVNAYSLLPITA